MFQTANWFLILFSFYGNNPTHPIGPFFTQQQCDAAYVQMMKNYPKDDYGYKMYGGHACVAVPVEGD